MTPTQLSRKLNNYIQNYYFQRLYSAMQNLAQYVAEFSICIQGMSCTNPVDATGANSTRTADLVI